MKRYFILGFLALSLVGTDVYLGAAQDQFGKRESKAVKKWEKDVRKKEQRDRKTTRKFAEKQWQQDRRQFPDDPYINSPFYDADYTYNKFDNYLNNRTRAYRPPRPFRQPPNDYRTYYEEIGPGYQSPRFQEPTVRDLYDAAPPADLGPG